MRVRLGLSAAIAATAVAVSVRGASAQSPPPVRYWPLREINYPVQIDALKALKPAPVKLRFYAAQNRGQFDLVAEKPLDSLEVINPDTGSRGFKFVSPGDGEYEFALMSVYADNDTNPRLKDLQAQDRVVIDTRPPGVSVGLVSRTEVEWEVQDENLKPDGVRVEVRWAGQSKWTTISPRAFAARDRYAWTGLKPNEPLEVRIVATDRTGHEGFSRLLSLPANSADGGLTRAGGTGTGFGNPDEFPNRPQIEYVNTTKLTVRAKLTRITRSGVKEAHLWVHDGSSGGWRKDKTVPANITPNSPDTTLPIEYSAGKDGLYGFIVIPVNGAGGKQDDPRAGDAAQYLVEVDTKVPDVRVTGVRVSPGGSIGPRVEIEWQADDKNLWPEPIVLQYREDNAGDWKSIHPGKLANTGRYIWEVEDKSLWRFHVRATATDKASNRGENVYDKQVIIDLETPRADIEKVQGAGGPPAQPYESQRQPVDSPPAPPPPVVRTPSQPVSPAPQVPKPSVPTPKDDSPPIPSLPTAPILPSVGK